MVFVSRYIIRHLFNGKPIRIETCIVIAGLLHKQILVISRRSLISVRHTGMLFFVTNGRPCSLYVRICLEVNVMIHQGLTSIPCGRFYMSEY